MLSECSQLYYSAFCYTAFRKLCVIFKWIQSYLRSFEKNYKFHSRPTEGAEGVTLSAVPINVIGKYTHIVHILVIYRWPQMIVRNAFAINLFDVETFISRCGVLKQWSTQLDIFAQITELKEVTYLYRVYFLPAQHAVNSKNEIDSSIYLLENR